MLEILRLFFRQTKWYKIHENESRERFFPKLRVQNSKEVVQDKEIGTKNDVEYYWFGYPNLHQYQERLKITVYCSFDFANFPFDNHQCDLNFGFIGYSSQTAILLPLIIFHGNESTYLGNNSIEIISSHSPEPFNINISSIKPFDLLDNGWNYNFAGMHMEFYRNSIGSLIGGYYVPTAIFSIFSLVSYSIDIDIVPGRLGLLVTLDLIFANVYNSVKGPENRGFSYIEVWMVGMQIPIIVGKFFGDPKSLTYTEGPRLTRILGLEKN